MCSATQKPQSLPIVSVIDRVHHLEGFVASFVAENSLSLSFALKLIQFAKECARDPKALDKLEMSRTTVAYKLTEGVSLCYRKKVVQTMKTVPFSINIDECVSSNFRKVFSIIVCYFDDDLGRTVIKHYENVDMIIVNTQSLKNKIVELFTRDEIPFSNIVSDLSDSTNYMRGKKGGLETLLHEIAPQRLDIDGDLCHHVHNAIPQFSDPFDKYIERYLDDIHTDMQYSVDILERLKDTCFILDISSVKPPERVPHRWLYLFDVLLVDNVMFDALHLIYYSWLSKGLYKDDMKEIMKKFEISKEGKASI